MYNLFKRSGAQTWEIKLLKNVIGQLPKEFKILEEQIDAGLLKGVVIGSANYVAFSHHAKVFSQFQTRDQKDYKITGVRVFDKKSKSQLLYTFYVSSGIIKGYSVKGADKYLLDIESADVSWFIQLFKEKEVEKGK
ncbi:hypothetical protein [Dyadobacter sp. NIV53]|uniref:hypothetical protein n=1 Tax=Dyadobacter sp. NIV53 TaxID=2861765 RepID=UPI001C8865AB|nr:hypothetical protein [Dyadobacter sp. NIV53]